PDHAELFAEPRHLALGVLPRSGLGMVDGFRERNAAPDIVHCLPIAVGAKGPEVERVAACGDSPHFLDEARFEHRARAVVDAVVEQLARRVEADFEYAVA